MADGGPNQTGEFGLYEISKAAKLYFGRGKGMNWILDRLREASTWRGLIGIATTFGVIISPELADKIIAVGIALVGVVEIIRKEKNEPAK
jgi:hypothetical protein